MVFISAEQSGDGRQVGLHLGGDVLQDEELLQIVGTALVDVFLVEMQEIGAADRQAGTAHHVGLDGRVGDVLRLHLGAGLHLDELPVGGRAGRLRAGRRRAGASGALAKHVHPREHPVVAEGRFVEAGGAVAEKAGGGLEGGVALPEVLGQQHPAGKALLRQLTHPVPGVKEGLLGLVDGIGQLAPVALQPEPLGALEARLETGLGESGNIEPWPITPAFSPSLGSRLAEGPDGLSAKVQPKTDV